MLIIDRQLPPSALGVDNPANKTRVSKGTYPPTSDQQRWDFWARFMEPLISTKFQVGLAGNHEIEPVRPCVLITSLGCI